MQTFINTSIRKIARIPWPETVRKEDSGNGPSKNEQKTIEFL